MDSYEGTLRDAGLRATRPRIKVLQVLHAAHVPLSIEDVAKKLRRSIDMVTIYRTLDTLCKIGLVERVELQKGRSYFELAEHGHHHHVVCVSCGAIDDINNARVEKALSTVGPTLSFSFISSHSLEFFGECKKCVNIRV